MAKKKQPRYTVTDGKLVLTLEVDEDDGGFVVTSPFDPRITTQADTLQEAFEMAYDVVALFEESEKRPRRKPNRAKAS
jgi:predicted RNase H-like HicB family nuclease